MADFNEPGRIPRLVKPGRVREIVTAARRAPTIAPATVAEVLSLHRLELIGTPRNLPLGWRNALVSVNTTGGKVVVKRYPARWQDDAITHEHSILAELEKAMFPAVRVRIGADGGSWAELEDGRYSVFDFIDGWSLTGCYLSDGSRRRALECAGRILARFHAVLADFEPLGAHHLGFDGRSGRRRRDLDWYRETIDQLEHIDWPAPAAENREWFAARASRVSSALEEADSVLRGSSLTRTVIHGDFGLHNILFTPGGVVHDLELARVDWALVDIVIASYRLPPAAAEIFTTGYRAAADLTAAEWELFPAVQTHTRLTGALQSLRTYLEEGGPERVRTSARRIEQALAQATP
jgi:Ser/Thr protein kinase RdoA (MazF antagonist)